MLWYSDEKYMLNTSALSSCGSGHIRPAAPVQAQAIPHQEPPIASATVVHGDPPAYSASRSMQVTLPNDCKPGSVITVTAPTGETLQITVPDNAEPGSVITTSY